MMRTLSTMTGTRFLAVILLCASAGTGFGYTDPNTAIHDLPDNSAVRLEHRNLIFGPVQTLSSNAGGIFFQNGTGYSTRVSIQSQQGSRYILFINEKMPNAPIYSEGSYIIRRDADTGDFTQVKVFLDGNPETYVRIFPEGTFSTMDVVMFGYTLHGKIPLRMPFEEVLLSPFSRVIEVTENLISWKHLLPRISSVDEHRKIEDIAEKIRQRLPELVDGDDGAMSYDGQFVYIEDESRQLDGGLNCSGFAKWVVDGFYYPLTGRYTDVREMKVKHLESRGNSWSEYYEEERDPYFGLDWTRNLARALSSIDVQSEDPERADLVSVPYIRYVEDVGYPVSNLDLVLYLAALERPGALYLGSINREFGEGPTLRQHVHVVVLLPYFNETGTFRVAVMERNVETGMSSLKSRYGDDFIHLVELRPQSGFSHR